MVKGIQTLAPALALTVVFLAGCDSPTQPVVPTPAPAPTPAPTPTPVPTPTPCSTCEAPVENTAPPVRLNLRLYTVEDAAGNFISNPDPNEPIALGLWARLDVTAKDKDNRETNGSSNVEFSFSNIRSIEVTGGHTHQRRVKGLEPVTVDCWAVLDGIRSNTLSLTFQ